jgi:hypothetical protein
MEREVAYKNSVSSSRCQNLPGFSSASSHCYRSLKLLYHWCENEAVMLELRLIEVLIILLHFVFLMKDPVMNCFVI